MTIQKINKCEKKSNKFKKLKNDLHSKQKVSKSKKRKITSSSGHESSMNLSSSNNNNINNHINFASSSCFGQTINKTENKSDNKNINNKMINSTTTIVNNYLRKNNTTVNNQQPYNSMSKSNLYKNPSFFNKRLANKIKYNDIRYENNVDKYKKNLLSKIKNNKNKNYQSIQCKPTPVKRVNKNKFSTNATKKKLLTSYKNADISNSNNKANTERNITFNNLNNLNSKSITKRLTQKCFDKKEELALKSSIISEKYKTFVINCDEDGRTKSKEKINNRYNTQRGEILHTEGNCEENYINSEKTDRVHMAKRIKIRINKKLIFNQKYNQNNGVQSSINKNIINKKDNNNKINNMKLAEDKKEKISIKIKSQKNLINPTLNFVRYSSSTINNPNKLKQFITLENPKNGRHNYNDPTIKIFLTNNNIEEKSKNDSIQNINNFNNCNYIYFLNNSCNSGSFHKENKFLNKGKKLFP